MRTPCTSCIQCMLHLTVELMEPLTPWLALCVPDFPKAPNPLLASLGAPFAWIYGRPDLFDSYSAGVLLMQMGVPQLRPIANIRLFNSEMKQCDYDLNV